MSYGPNYEAIAEKERLAIKEWVNEQMGDMQGIPMYGATSHDMFLEQRGSYRAFKIVLDYLHSRDAKPK
jgi:hypothetical protein